MSSLYADVRDVTNTLDDLGALFLLSPRHMRTVSGRSLLEGVQKLRAKIFELTSEVAKLKARDVEFDSQRSVIERLTAELEAEPVRVSKRDAHLFNAHCVAYSNEDPEVREAFERVIEALTKIAESGDDA